MSDPSYRTLKEKIKKKVRPKPPSYLLAALPLAAAAFIPYIANGAPLNHLTAILYTSYLGICLASIYQYLRHAHIVSLAFVGFCVILIIDALSLYVSNIIQGSLDPETQFGHYSMFGAFFNLYTSDLLKVFVFVLGAALVRMVYLVYSDNREFFEEKETSELRSHGLAAFKLWYPMLLIFAGFGLGYHYLYSSKIEPALIGYVVGCKGDQLIDEVTEFSPSCPGDMYDSDGELISLEVAMLKTNERKLALLNQQKTQALGNYAQVTADTANEAPDRVYNDLQQAFPRRLPGTRTRSCGLNPVCLIENGIKSATNSAYVSVKNRQLRKIRGKLRAIANDVDESVDEKARQMNLFVETSIQKFESMTEIAVISSFEGVYWLSRLLFI